MIATGFTSAWLDRADPVRSDERALAAALANPRARLLRLENGDPAVDADGGIAWTSIANLDGTPIFLGLDDEQRPYFAEARQGDAAGPARSGALMRMLDTMPPGDAAIFGMVRSVTGWHARNGYCANCGTATAIIRGGWARLCASCGAEHYPRVDPVVIMLAEFQGRALVGRQAAWPAGRYSALAGFVEPGESLEEAVARELFEEAGVRVSDVRYLASQPWPFPGQLMLAAIGTADSDALTIDAKEIEDAFWVAKDEVRAALAGADGALFLPPPSYAIARTLLEEWAAA